MSTLRTFLLIAAVLQAAGCAEAGEYYVAVGGSDRNPGTKDRPFATIQKAADVMQAGDTCIVGGGTYRQSVVLKGKSGTKDKPICFIAAKGQRVVLDGSEPVRGEWSVYKGRTYRTKLQVEPFEQLFVDGRMQVEARWPNMRFEQRWDRSRWADSARGSRQDLMICPALAKTGIDWTGAVATLNVAHQFKTWTRTVLKHEKGSPRFTYELSERLSNGAADGPAWWNDKLFLAGKLEALDAPTEWYYDADTGVLYLHADDGRSPAGRSVAYKRRLYAFDVSESRHVRIQGFSFFATTFRFLQCEGCVVEDCRLRFPTYARRLTDMDPKPQRKASPATQMIGSNNVIRRVGLKYSNTHGLVVRGEGNLVENCIVRDVNWVGAIAYAGITAYTPASAKAGSRVSRCTVSTVGNIGIHYRGPNNVIEHNHVHHTGLACKDIAAVHTGSPACRGSVAHHNWVHDSTGKGLRGDDQTRGLTFHHNVVWNCEDPGIIIKGDHNRVVHNTLVGRKHAGILLIPTRPEPKKWWTRTECLPVQNRNSLIVNNAIVGIQWRYKRPDKHENITHNLRYPGGRAAAWLMDPENLDFRPRKGSPLIDAGRIIEGFTDGFKGKAPDVGAYEHGGENWKAGADWTDEP